MDAQVERQYQSLKVRCGQLGYSQPFGIDSAAIVDRLINDLNRTTQGFVMLKKEKDRLENQLKLQSTSEEPIKKEYQKVMEENNELHIQLMRQKEQADQEISQFKLDIRKLQTEKEEAVFKLHQTEERSRSNENQARSSFQGSLNEGKSTNMWAEELKQSENKMLEFRQKCSDLVQDNEALAHKASQLERQILNRDDEIRRLSLLAQGGAAFENIKSANNGQSVSTTILNLEKKVEYLTAENIRIEQEQKDVRQTLITFVHHDGREQLNAKVMAKKLTDQNQKLQDDLFNTAKKLEMLQSERFVDTNSLTSQELAKTKEYQFELEAKCAEFERENRRLKADVEKNSNVQSALQSNSRAYVDKVDSLQKELQDALDKLDVKEQEAIKLGDELHLQKEDNTVLKGKVSNLMRDYEMAQQFANKASTENSSHTQLFNQMQAQVQQATQRLSDNEHDLRQTKHELMIARTEKGKLEETLNKMKTDTMKSESSSQVGQVTSQRLQAQLSAAQKDLQVLRQQRDSLEEVIQNQKSELESSRKEGQSYYEQMLALKENFNIMQNEQKNLSDELTERQSNSHKLEKEKMQLERELLTLRPLKTQLENFSVSTQKQIQEHAQTEYEKNKLQHKVTELEHENSMKLQDLKELDQKYSEMVGENVKLMDQLRSLDKESYEINTKIRRGIEAEKENENHNMQIENLRNSEKKLQSQVEEFKMTLRQKDQQLEREIGKFQNMSKFSKSLEQEIQSLREQILSLNSKFDQDQTKTIEQSHRFNQAKIEIIDKEQTMESLKAENGRLLSDLSEISKQFEDEKVKCTTLEQQCSRMKSLIENLDSTKEELVKRLQSTTQDKNHESSDKQVLIGDLTSFKKQLQGKDQEISDLRKTIEGLDRNIDELNSELERKTEEVYSAKALMDKQTKEFSNIQHNMSVVTGKEDNYQKRLYEREQEIHDVRRQLEDYRVSLEETTNIAKLKQQEVTELMEDIQTLTRENKFVNTEFGKTSQAADYLKKANEELQKSERDAQQKLRALEMDKDDVISNYRNACAEIKRLESSVHHSQGENQEMFGRIQILEKELAISQKGLEDAYCKEQNMVCEIRTLESHIDHLSHQQQMSHKALQEVSQQKEGVIGEMQSVRQIQQQFEREQEEMTRYNHHLQAQTHQAEQKCQDFEREADALRQQIKFEQEERRELEQVLANERYGQHENHRESKDLMDDLRRVTEDFDREVRRNQRLEERIQTLDRHRQLNESSVIEQSGYREVCEENSKLKETIIHYEQQIAELEKMTT